MSSSFGSSDVSQLVTPAEFDPTGPLTESGEKPNGVTRSVVERLIRMIEAGELQPGYKLPPQRNLSADLNVSRTALREALSTLKSTGHLTTLPNGRVVVRSEGLGDQPAALPSWEFAARYSLVEIYQFRLLVEGHAANLAALNCEPEHLAELVQINQRMKDHALASEFREFVDEDLRFHQKIMEMTGSRLLVDLQLSFARDLFESHSRPLSRKDTLNVVTDEHEMIISALRHGDGDGAAYFVRRHIHKAAERAGIFL